MQHVMPLPMLPRVTVIEVALNYEDSCGIDDNLPDAVKIQKFEPIELSNINNGAWFSTYMLKAPRNSWVTSLNVTATRNAMLKIARSFCTYGAIAAKEVVPLAPAVIMVIKQNHVKGVKT